LGSLGSLLFFLPIASERTYFSLLIGSNTAVSSPPVELQQGTAGNSTIYANKTSALVSVDPSGTGGTDTEDYVDNNTSDVDNSNDLGTHSNFTAQQYGPDLINDTLTEENTGGSGGNGTLWLYVNADDGSWTDWTRVGTNPYLDAIDYSANFVNVSGNLKLVGDFNFTDSGKSTETIDSVEVQLYAKQSGTNNNLEVFVWDGSSWPSLSTQVTPMSWGWMNWTATTELDTWTKIDGAKIYIKSKSAVGTYEVDCARLKVNYSEPEANHELDLEVQWTNVDYNEFNEALCIYGGLMGAENITVDVWNSTGWENLFTDLNSGWNNISISSYLDSSNFTIRFKGATETGDTTQTSWNIDATLLHVWTEPIVDYVDNNTSDVDTSADRGTHSNFTAQQYGPDSINDTLTEENLGDKEDYVDEQSDVDSSADVGTHSSFAALQSLIRCGFTSMPTMRTRLAGRGLEQIHTLTLPTIPQTL
jgi:hypothetical protein